MAVASDEKGGRQSEDSGLLEQATKIVNHMETYPYVWASYVVVFGGLGLYGAFAWRNMRLAEREVLRLQSVLKAKSAQREAAADASKLDP